jgi:hypothetical protein
MMEHDFIKSRYTVPEKSQICTRRYLMQYHVSRMVKNYLHFAFLLHSSFAFYTRMTLKQDMCTVYVSIVISLKTVVVLSVERLATDRTVQVLNPGGENKFSVLHTYWSGGASKSPV